MSSFKRFSSVRRSNRGSVLLVSLLLSAIIAASVVYFLRLATSASQISYRTYYLGVGMNIAETGLEQALWSVNRSASGVAGSWDSWEDVPSGTLARRRTFDLGGIEGGASTQVKVYAQERVGSTSPFIIARAIVTPNQGTPIEKWIRVTLSRRSLFAVGALGEKGIAASGNNVYFASWNSDPDNDPNTIYLTPTQGGLHAKASLATTDLDASIDSGNADVNGTAAVGSDDLDDIKVGAQGYIGPFGTTAGTKDPNSVSTDFTADLTVPTAPDKTYVSLGAITTNFTLPRVGDSPDADGNYYYKASELTLNNETLSITQGTNVVLFVDNDMQAIDVGGGSGAIQIGGTITTNTSTGVTTYVAASLKVYTPGDVTVSGQGTVNNDVLVTNYTPATTTTTTIQTTTTISNIVTQYGSGRNSNVVKGWTYDETITTTTTVGSNTPTSVSKTTSYTANASKGDPQPVAGSTTVTETRTGSTPESTTVVGSIAGQPKTFQLYGTRTDEDAKPTASGPQNISISGNGNLSGVVYAPNADIEAKGGGNSGYIYGSVVGESLKFTGNDSFYYDESLAKLDDDARYGIESWNELVEYVDRNAYSAFMNF